MVHCIGAVIVLFGSWRRCIGIEGGVRWLFAFFFIRLNQLCFLKMVQSLKIILLWLVIYIIAWIQCAIFYHDGHIQYITSMRALVNRAVLKSIVYKRDGFSLANFICPCERVNNLILRRLFVCVNSGQQLFLGKLYRSLDKWYFLVVWLNRFALNFLYKYNTMVPIPKKTIEQYIEYEYVILKPLFHALVIFPLTCHSHASFKYN